MAAVYASASASSPAPPRNMDGALSWYSGLLLGFLGFVPLLLLCDDAVREAATHAGLPRPSLGDARFLLAWAGAAAVIARLSWLLRGRWPVFARGFATGAGVLAGAMLLISATHLLWGD